VQWSVNTYYSQVPSIWGQKKVNNNSTGMVALFDHHCQVRGIRYHAFGKSKMVFVTSSK